MAHRRDSLVWEQRTMTQALSAEATPTLRRRRRPERRAALLDGGLLLAVLCLLGLGFIMVASASMPMADRNYDDPFFFVLRHGIALALAVTIGALCFAVPPKVWEGSGPLLMLLGIALLLVLLVPGVGRTVNGATRWIPLGVINLQPSELLKFTSVIYLSGYLVHRELEVRTSLAGFLRPMLLIGIAGMLIMAQPDFGTTAVILATSMGLLFLGGVSVLSFVALGVLVLAGLVALIIVEPYRLARVISFVAPFEDPFNTGYQLSQALIAFGRGEWLGVGLGHGIQKQFYLPEAHTDFLLAVIGEEFGLVGVLIVIALFAFITWRAFEIGARARLQGALFSCYAAHGFGLLIGLQAFINVGVNTGLLPTKGLPLPFMSYGSNAVIVAVMATAVLLRIDFELRRKTVEPIPEGGLHRERPAPPPTRPLRERSRRERGATWR
jgi:cell division protein FtsW